MKQLLELASKQTMSKCMHKQPTILSSAMVLIRCKKTPLQTQVMLRAVYWQNTTPSWSWSHQIDQERTWRTWHSTKTSIILSENFFFLWPLINVFVTPLILSEWAISYCGWRTESHWKVDVLRFVSTREHGINESSSYHRYTLTQHFLVHRGNNSFSPLTLQFPLKLG